ncbi:hypothetical protein NXS19_005032 [Fusarium pseudograminearum]|nr:hypothetical protein NXS19_005032 [Fusarium pseudograminearum]
MDLEISVIEAEEKSRIKMTMPPPLPPVLSTTHQHDLDAASSSSSTSILNIIKPPVPGRRPRTAQSHNNSEVLVPPLIAGTRCCFRICPCRRVGQPTSHPLLSPRRKVSSQHR